MYGCLYLGNPETGKCIPSSQVFCEIMIKLLFKNPQKLKNTVCGYFPLIALKYHIFEIVKTDVEEPFPKSWGANARERKASIEPLSFLLVRSTSPPKNQLPSKLKRNSVLAFPGRFLTKIEQGSDYEYCLGCQSLASTASDNRMNVELSLRFALVFFFI